MGEVKGRKVGKKVAAMRGGVWGIGAPTFDALRHRRMLRKSVASRAHYQANLYVTLIPFLSLRAELAASRFLRSRNS